MHNLEEFIDRIVAEKGFDTKDPEVLAQIKADLLGRLEDRINAMILSELPQDKLEEFEKMLDAGNGEAINNFLKENISDAEQKLATVMLEFKSIYLA